MIRRMMRSSGGEAEDIGRWLESLDGVLRERGQEAARKLLSRANEAGGWREPVSSGGLSTPYVNPIPANDQSLYPGDLEIEARIRSLIRWNALAIVVKANRQGSGIGGHISKYARHLQFGATVLRSGRCRPRGIQSRGPGRG